mmetsp:Transcript_7871/g.25712  ORF Transcript_7871/g.25712 Transcript_7871/m.25712 type:complete len:266 (+) Transcript_7871:965-1762(+)
MRPARLMPATSTPFLTALKRSTHDASTKRRLSAGMACAIASVVVARSSTTARWPQASAQRAGVKSAYIFKTTTGFSSSECAMQHPSASKCWCSTEATQPSRSLSHSCESSSSARSQIVRPWPETTAYAKNTGLHSMSDPRRFVSQAIWSSAFMHSASPRSAAETRRSLEATLSPDSASGCGTTALQGTFGRRLDQTISTKFGASRLTTSAPDFKANSSAKPTVASDAWMPTRLPAHHSSSPGTPGSPCFISVHGEPSSCVAAWLK